RDWYEVLWDSVAEVPDPEAPILGVDDPEAVEGESSESSSTGAPTEGGSTGENTDGETPAEGESSEGANSDEPVGNVVEEEEDAPDPVGEMPVGEVPSGQ
ncbi:MAG: septum formation initiator family protein, partial [Corynebacterium casei]|nr:septum formation initiator family protein [Corynebacterium casei]